MMMTASELDRYTRDITASAYRYYLLVLLLCL